MDVVRSVSGQLPDENGGVALRAEHIGALPLSGGTMTGDIDLGGNTLRNLKVPADAADAATKGYVDGKRLTFSAVLAKTWEGTGPYTQTVPVSGILETDMPHVTPVYKSDASDTEDIVNGRIAQWGKVSYAEAVTGGIRFVCMEEPAFDYLLRVQIEVMR